MSTMIRPTAPTFNRDAAHLGGVKLEDASSFQTPELLARILQKLEQLLQRDAVKPHYSVEEFAATVKRAPFTVRQWCNEGRIHAVKSMTQSGSSCRWVISHTEYERFIRDGLLPLRRVG